MVLDSYRSRFDLLLEPISRFFISVNPNAISVISLILAALTGLFYYFGTPVFLAGAFVALIFSSLFDAVDGKVARMRKMASKKGDLVDHVLDRYADIFILLGMTFSPFGNITIGMLAIIGVIMTSYMGTQAQALGLKRNYSGILGRADRLVMILAFIIIQIIVRGSIQFYGVALTVTVILLIWFAIGGNITALKRFKDSLDQV